MKHDDTVHIQQIACLPLPYLITRHLANFLFMRTCTFLQWTAVQKNPSDFAAWTALIGAAEKLVSTAD